MRFVITGEWTRNRLLQTIVVPLRDLRRGPVGHQRPALLQQDVAELRLGGRVLPGLRGALPHAAQLRGHARDRALPSLRDGHAAARAHAPDALRAARGPHQGVADQPAVRSRRCSTRARAGSCASSIPASRTRRSRASCCSRGASRRSSCSRCGPSSRARSATTTTTTPTALEGRAARRAGGARLRRAAAAPARRVLRRPPGDGDDPRDHAVRARDAERARDARRAVRARAAPRRVADALRSEERALAAEPRGRAAARSRSIPSWRGSSRRRSATRGSRAGPST